MVETGKTTLSGSPAKIVIKPDELIKIRNHCMKLAQTLHEERNEELVELSVRSVDFHHRIAAAWCYGLSMQYSDCLGVLLIDEHPLVSCAARESLICIANDIPLPKLHRVGHYRIDFGPKDLQATKPEKESCLSLWEAFFDKRKKSLGEKPPVEKVLNKPKDEPKKRTPAEILGIE